VWSVYGVAALIIGGLSVAPVLKRRRFIREESQRLRRERQAAAGRVGG
jgi:heme exporter protein CcmD